MTATGAGVRAAVVDPSAYTPAYDHALCAALAGAGASVQLVTSRFAYGEVPAPDGYVVREFEKNGWTWGGRWPDRQDYQHFEKPPKK